MIGFLENQESLSALNANLLISIGEKRVRRSEKHDS